MSSKRKSAPRKIFQERDESEELSPQSPHSNHKSRGSRKSSSSDTKEQQQSRLQQKSTELLPPTEALHAPNSDSSEFEDDGAREEDQSFSSGIDHEVTDQEIPLSDSDQSSHSPRSQSPSPITLSRKAAMVNHHQRKSSSPPATNNNNVTNRKVSHVVVSYILFLKFLSFSLLFL